MLLLWLGGIQGGSDSSTHIQVCTHMQACTTQTDVWQIALLRPSEVPVVAPLLVDYQFLSSRNLRNVLLSVWISWVIMSKMTSLSLCFFVQYVNTGANCSSFMCVAYDLESALQTGLRAWLNLRWQVKPLLHESFSVCSYCVMTTFQPLWATVWHSLGWAGHLPFNLIPS